MNYNELFEKYNLLLTENQKLKSENAELRKRLGFDVLSENIGVNKTENNSKAKGIVSDNINNSNADGTINKFSSTDVKIKLFRSLFKGREDVFARRWESVTTGKSGYQPVCGNEWVEGVCDKRKYKCSACPNRKLLSITDKDIFKHLSGKDEHCRDVIGIYPMLPGETCNFLCADFDEADYQKDAVAFCKVCKEMDIPAYIERSRSGNGAHVWIFFDEPIYASVARKLGSGILTRVMERRSEISFKSYDRLFPNQDIMPSGGFGNLIALPLQGRARKEGNSVFVGENFVPYDDQWSFLNSVKRLSKDSVESLVSQLSKGGELGVLLNEKSEKPWESKKTTELTRFDFPPMVEFLRANMLYIPKTRLSEIAKNAIKRLAAFKNPDFYRAQSMRLPVYDKSRIICTAEETDEYIAIPRGCESALCHMIEDVDVGYIIDDKTNYGERISAEFNGTLREEQQPAADALLEKDNGVLSATTAFGKTVIASYIVSQRKVNTLVLVHTQALMQQWKKSLEQFLNLNIEAPKTKKGKVKKNWSPIGVLGAGKNTLGGVVDVAVMQSLTSGDEVKELVRNYGMIIVDECHHVSAVNFETVLKYTNAKYVYGLTATPTRSDGHHPIIFMQCGPIRYRVDAKAQAEKRAFEHYLIPRFTSYRSVDTDKGIAAVYKELSENEIRNLYIVKDVVEALNQGRTPIILTERREHVLLLAERLSGHCKNIITLFGTASQKERRETMQRLESVSDDEQLVIIATGKYVGEGFDYSRLDTLFLALPIAWNGKVAQYAGRLHRSYPGKTDVRIYDYVDIRIPVLEKMYQKRLKSYMSIGYKIKVDTALHSAPNLIYDGRNFYKGYCEDIKAASKGILIVSQFMRKGRVTQLLTNLTAAILNGVDVTVITRPPEDFKEKEQKNVIEITEKLTEYGVKVKYRSGFHQKFTVIDNEIVWYGSVNFLSFGIAEESIMRFASTDIAGQLMDTVV